MFQKKIILLIALSFLSANVFAQTSKKLKNLKHARRSAASSSNVSRFEAVSLIYEAKTSKSTLTDVKLNLSPFVNFISFKISKSKKNKKIIMDCHVSEDYTKWECGSACEGGDLEISFNDDIKFNLIKIKPFKIRERSCDGFESAKDKTIISKRPLIFKIDRLSLKQTD